jgi:hypothetical protein
VLFNNFSRGFCCRVNVWKTEKAVVLQGEQGEALSQFFFETSEIVREGWHDTNICQFIRRALTLQYILKK